MSYYSLTSLALFLEKYKIIVNSVKLIPIHGGSIRVYCSRHRSNTKPLNLAKFLFKEWMLNLWNTTCFKKLNNRISKSKIKNQKLLENLLNKGAIIDAYGASGRAVTLHSYFELDKYINQYYDDSPLRQEKMLPGTVKTILDSSHIYDCPPDFIYITSWTFAKDIIKKHPNYKGKWIIPLPKLKIL
jgi:hypothetical protein